MKSLLFALLAIIFSFTMNSQNMVAVSSIERKITTVRTVDYIAKRKTNNSSEITQKNASNGGIKRVVQSIEIDDVNYSSDTNSNTTISLSLIHI